MRQHVIQGRVAPHYCVVCDSLLDGFLPKGSDGRAARCPACGSLERHRFLWLFLQKAQYTWRHMNVLHVAAEPCMQRQMRTLGAKRYITTDLQKLNVNILSDLTALPFKSSSFDLIIASHVLEHVVDDHAGFREIRRILTPRGVALLQVPFEFEREETLELGPCASSDDRRRILGHWTHRRSYGQDLSRRIRRAGLTPKKYSVDRFYAEDQIFRLGLSSTEEPIDRESIWVCQPEGMNEGGTTEHACRIPIKQAADLSKM
jgi:SAM-dependent methyltransferase